MSDTSSPKRSAYLVMVVAPLLFSTNLIFGRGVISDVSPFTLALMRWLAVAVALSPLMFVERKAIAALLRTQWLLLAVLAFLGMWLCGGAVYLALQWTTATNATLIYTTAPIIILLLEALFRGQPIGLREGVGAAIGFVGIVTIVMRGDIGAVLALDFNAGDLIILVAAIAWAGYSILLRAPPLQVLSTGSLLGLLALVGAVLLLPTAMIEWTLGARFPQTATAWGGVAGIVIFSSLLAFSAFQFGIRRLSASVAGVFMYLMPPYGVLLAALFLGEALHGFHIVGIVLVMGGVILATFPKLQGRK